MSTAASLTIAEVLVAVHPFLYPSACLLILMTGMYVCWSRVPPLETSGMYICPVKYTVFLRLCDVNEQRKIHFLSFLEMTNMNNN